MSLVDSTARVRLNAVAATFIVSSFCWCRPAAAGDVRTEHITDPTLNGMVAFDVRVPADWHFQGTLGQGGQCVGVPFQVFRLTSPDGLSFVERMPTLGWSWGSGPGLPSNKDCLPLKEGVSAQQFLKFLSSTLKVEYVADAPVPAEENARAQKNFADAAAVYAPKYAASGIKPPHQTRELARAIVRFKNGSFVMKGLLQATVDCMESYLPGMKSGLRGVPDRPPTTTAKCNAGVRYTVAPEDRFPRVLATIASGAIGASPNAAWEQAWLQRNQRQGEQMVQQIAQQGAAQLAASAAQFNHDQAVRQRMHEQFLSTMQRGTDLSMARAAQVANSNHAIAQDWVDYSLDQQTVRDPHTGQVSKVASGYNATWVDSSGKASYQTNDANANPNGTLPGNWTRQQVVHGDGSN